MVQYICNRCDKIFDKKCNYEGHKNRKFICKEVIREVIPSPPDNTVIINTLIEQNNIIKNELDEFKANAVKKTDELKTLYSREIDNLKKMFMELQKTQVNSNNNNNNINIGNTTNNTINIIMFDNSDKMTPLLLKDEIIKILKSNDCIKEAIRQCYFNERIPQYKNIDVTANQGEYDCTVYDGKNFIRRDSDILAKQLLDKSYNVTSDCLAINETHADSEKISKSVAKRITTRMETYKGILDSLDETSEAYEPVISDLASAVFKEILKTTSEMKI